MTELRNCNLFCPEATQFSWGGGSMVFEDAQGNPLCSVSWDLIENIATWVAKLRDDRPLTDFERDVAIAMSNAMLNDLI